MRATMRSLSPWRLSASPTGSGETLLQRARRRRPDAIGLGVGAAWPGTVKPGGHIVVQACVDFRLSHWRSGVAAVAGVGLMGWRQERNAGKRCDSTRGENLSG